MSTAWERLASEPVLDIHPYEPGKPIVRPMTSFGPERALRITVGTPEENRRLIEALRTVLGARAARS
jgi:histidinol-phosphate/aromatic aminotransferase/cobyric acid decarboxylase-like protein